MTRIDRFAAGVGMFAFSLVAMADDHGSVQRKCSEKTNLTYGYICTGQAQVIPGMGLEPVTLVGTVSGSPTGFFDGRGTFTASFGSAKQHLMGPAVFQDKTCFGHVKYRVFATLANGADGMESALDIDFATVDGGNEILGAPTGYGASGADVPRLSCRLVNVKSSD